MKKRISKLSSAICLTSLGNFIFLQLEKMFSFFCINTYLNVSIYYDIHWFGVKLQASIDLFQFKCLKLTNYVEKYEWFDDYSLF